LTDTGANGVKKPAPESLLSSSPTTLSVVKYLKAARKGQFRHMPISQHLEMQLQYMQWAR
jgi:hypothetical protein